MLNAVHLLINVDVTGKKLSAILNQQDVPDRLESRGRITLQLPEEDGSREIAQSKVKLHSLESAINKKCISSSYW